MRTQSRSLLHTTAALTAAAIVSALTPCAHADGVSPEHATAVQREQAQTRFTRGRDLFKAAKYDEALTELRSSHEIVSSPNTRLMIARCYRELGSLVEAYAEFGRTSVEARELQRSDPRYKQAAETAERERADLESKLGFVIVDVRNAQPATTLKVGGELIRTAAWGEPTPALPGSAEVLVETPGRAPIHKTVTLAAGQRTTVSIDAAGAEPAPATATHQASLSSSSSLRTWAYVSGGVGVVGLATFAIAGSMANATYNDLDQSCAGTACPPDRKSDVDAGRQQQTIANIGLAVGVVGLGAGITLYMLGKPAEGSSAGSALVVSPGWVGVRGRM